MRDMHRGYLKTGAILGALSVAMGAFAAHKLKEMVDPEAVAIFETGVRYQFYHVFALLAVGILGMYYKNKSLKWAGIMFIAGTVLFSGSLYLLTYIHASGVEGMKWVGPITPLGGVCFIAGWILLFVSVASYDKELPASQP